MSKSALHGLVKGLARDLGPRGITINTVQPGPVDTDMNPAEGEFAEMLKKLMALPRYPRPTRSPRWSRTSLAPKPASSRAPA